MECFTGSGGRSRLGASRRPFGDGSCYRHSQPSPHNPYGVLAFDEFTDEAKSLRCLSYLTNRARVNSTTVVAFALAKDIF